MAVNLKISLILGMIISLVGYGALAYDICNFGEFQIPHWRGCCEKLPSSHAIETVCIKINTIPGNLNPATRSLKLAEIRLPRLNECVFKQNLNLDHLSINDCEMESIDPRQPLSGSMLASLQMLSLSYNELEMLDIDVTFPRLHTLDLSHNKIQSITWRTFVRFPKLGQLNLQDNQLKIIPDNFHSRLSINSIKSLELNLNDNPLTCNVRTTGLICQVQVTGGATCLDETRNRKIPLKGMCQNYPAANLRIGHESQSSRPPRQSNTRSSDIHEQMVVDPGMPIPELMPTPRQTDFEQTHDQTGLYSSLNHSMKVSGVDTQNGWLRDLGFGLFVTAVIILLMINIYLWMGRKNHRQTETRVEPMNPLNRTWV